MIDLKNEVSSADGEDSSSRCCEEKRLLAHKFQVCLDLVDNLKREQQQQQQANSSSSSVCGEETINRSGWSIKIFNLTIHSEYIGNLKFKVKFKVKNYQLK